MSGDTIISPLVRDIASRYSRIVFSDCYVPHTKSARVTLTLRTSSGTLTETVGVYLPALNSEWLEAALRRSANGLFRREGTPWRPDLIVDDRGRDPKWDDLLSWVYDVLVEIDEHVPWDMERPNDGPVECWIRETGERLYTCHHSYIVPLDTRESEVHRVSFVRWAEQECQRWWDSPPAPIR